MDFMDLLSQPRPTAPPASAPEQAPTADAMSIEDVRKEQQSILDSLGLIEDAMPDMRTMGKGVQADLMQLVGESAFAESEDPDDGAADIAEIQHLVREVMAAGSGEEEDEQDAEEPEEGTDNKWANIGVREVPGWSFEFLDGRKLGNVRFVSGSSMKAQCAIHGSRCHCWIQSSENIQSIEQDLVLWLAQAHDLDAAEHAQSAYEIKVSYGMRPRKPTLR